MTTSTQHPGFPAHLRYAGAENLHPTILQAIITIVADNWDREHDDYQHLDTKERDDHPYRHLTVLHNFLGPHTPIR